MMFEGYTEDGQVSGDEACWGAPLMGRITELVVSPQLPKVPPYVTISQVVPDSFRSNAVIDATKKLKDIANKIEKDIAYFSKFKGQGMATNKLGVLKLDLLEIAKQLEL